MADQKNSNAMDAMMDDLGDLRMEELAQDDNRRGGRQPPVRHSVARPAPGKESMTSVWSQMYQNAVETGLFNDDDAQGVRNLDSIADGNLARINRQQRQMAEVSRFGFASDGGRGGFQGGIQGGQSTSSGRGRGNGGVGRGTSGTGRGKGGAGRGTGGAGRGNGSAGRGHGGTGRGNGGDANIIQRLMRNTPYDPANPNGRGSGRTRGGDGSGGGGRGGGSSLPPQRAGKSGQQVSSVRGLVPPGKTNGRWVPCQASTNNAPVPPTAMPAARPSPSTVPPYNRPKPPNSKPSMAPHLRGPKSGASSMVKKDNHPTNGSLPPHPRHTSSTLASTVPENKMAPTVVIIPPHIREKAPVHSQSGKKTPSAGSANASRLRHRLSTQGPAPMIQATASTTTGILPYIHAAAPSTLRTSATPSVPESAPAIKAHVEIPSRTPTISSGPACLPESYPPPAGSTIGDDCTPIKYYYFQSDILMPKLNDFGDMEDHDGQMSIYGRRGEQNIIWELDMANGSLHQEDIRVLLDPFKNGSTLIIRRQDRPDGPLRSSVVKLPSISFVHQFVYEVARQKMRLAVLRESIFTSPPQPTPAATASVAATITAHLFTPAVAAAPPIAHAPAVPVPAVPALNVPATTVPAVAATASPSITSAPAASTSTKPFEAAPDSAVLTPVPLSLFMTITDPSGLWMDLSPEKLINTGPTEPEFEAEQSSPSYNDLEGLHYTIPSEKPTFSYTIPAEEVEVISSTQEHDVAVSVLGHASVTPMQEQPVASEIDKQHVSIALEAKNSTLNVEIIERIPVGIDLSRDSMRILAPLEFEDYLEIISYAKNLESILGLEEQAELAKASTLQVCLYHLLRNKSFIKLSPAEMKKTLAVVFSNVRQMQTGEYIQYKREDLLGLRRYAGTCPETVIWLADPIVLGRRINHSSTSHKSPAPSPYRLDSVINRALANNDWLYNKPATPRSTGLMMGSTAGSAVTSVAGSTTEYIADQRKMSEKPVKTEFQGVKTECPKAVRLPALASRTNRVASPFRFEGIGTSLGMRGLCGSRHASEDSKSV